MNLAPSLQALAWALLHFLWQGALLGMGAALALRLTRRRGPQVRYALGLGFLALAPACVLATWWLLRPAVPGALPLPVLGPGAEQVAASGALPLLARGRLALAPALPWIFWGWATGSGFLALRLAGGWLWLQRLKARMEPLEEAWEARLRNLAARMGLRRAFRAGMSQHIATPMVIGWIRPVLLIPASLVTGLEVESLEALLAHELAHLRRHDVFFNWMQCAVEVLLFYHPAVWWLSKRVRLERECCCDDAAVALSGDPLRYAETLDRLDDLRTFALSTAQAANGGHLMFRITRLLSPKADAPRVSLVLPLLALAAAGALSLPAQQPAPKAEPAGQAAPAPKPSPKPSPAPKAKAEGHPTPAPKEAPQAQLHREISFHLWVLEKEGAKMDLFVDNATRAEVEEALGRIEALAKSRAGGENHGVMEGKWHLKAYKGNADDLLAFDLRQVSPTEARRLY